MWWPHKEVRGHRGDRWRRLSVRLAARVLGVSQGGYYAWGYRPPSGRAVRHAWLTEQIQAAHHTSNGTYGARRVHAELRLGHGILVSRNAVEMLMHRAGLKGLPGSRRPRPKHQTPPAADRVDRQFTRPARDQSWVTDITEHPDPGRQALLRGRPGRVLAPVGGLVHRQHPDRHLGDQRPGHGHPQPHTRPRTDHPLRPRTARRVQLVVATLR